MKDTTYPYLTLKQTPDNSLRMRKYIKGMSITMFASFLAWTGMVVGSIFTLVALNSTPIPLFFVSITLFIFSVALWKNIVNKNMNRMKTLIKIGCYIIGGFELLVLVPIIYNTLLATYGVLVTPISGLILLLIIPVFIFCTIYTIFVSLMIQGVRKSKPCLVNSYIIFKIVIFALFTLSIIMYGQEMNGFQSVFNSHREIMRPAFPPRKLQLLLLHRVLSPSLQNHKQEGERGGGECQPGSQQRFYQKCLVHREYPKPLLRGYDDFYPDCMSQNH